MKIDFKLFMLLGFIAFLSACTDDLNVTPEDDDVFLADDFYADPSSYEEALAGIYGNLSLTGSGDAGSTNIFGLDAGTSNYSRCLWYLQNLTTDETIWSYENDPGVRELQRTTWTASNPLLRGMFSRAMFTVALTNEFLRQSTEEKLNDRNVPSDVRAEIPAYRAEARLLRAMAYYHLMDTFGKATFVTENDPVGNYQGPEYNRAQLFEFIENELNAIEDDLVAPRENVYPRADRAVAWMILAKMYLNAEVYFPNNSGNRYQDCLDMCTNIINAGYSLTPDYAYNFLSDSETNGAQNEIIFAITSDGAVTQNYGVTTVMINGEVGSVEGNGPDLGVDGWGGALRVRPEFAEKFIDGASPASDSRNTLIIGDRPIEINDIGDRGTGYVITKWKNVTSAGQPGISTVFVDTDFTLFRLADVYLMYAECTERLNPGSNNSTSLGYLNALRSRANIAAPISNYNLSYIIDERSRELYWEAHRRQDLIRFGLFTGSDYNWSWKGNAPGGLGISNHLKLFPIPTETLSSNPNLSQNDGY